MSEEGNSSADKVDVKKISDRIRKLLAVAGGKGSTPNEVETAAAMAQKLMQDAKLTEADITDLSEDGSTIVDVPAGAEGFMASWKFSLVTNVSRSFFCEAVGLRVGRRRKVRIIGRKADTEAVLAVMSFLVPEIDRLVDEDAKSGAGNIFEETIDLFFSDGSKSRERREAYRAGLASGVSVRLRDEARNFAASSEKALVVVSKSKEELHSYSVGKFGEPKVGENDLRKGVAEEHFDRGYVRGKEIDARAGRKSLP